MSLFDRYVQVKHLSNQEALSRQNRAILHATAAQNAHLEALQDQLEQANQQQQQLLRYQKAQHAAREHQKFLKDAVFTINEILSYVESIEDRNAQFAVLMGCYSTVHDLLGQTIDQLEEIHDKVAASKLKERLVQIKKQLEMSEVQFQNSEIGKYMAAKMKYDELAGPMLIELNKLVKGTRKPMLHPELLKRIEEHVGKSIEEPESESGREVFAKYKQRLETKTKRRGMAFMITLGLLLISYGVMSNSKYPIRDLAAIPFLLSLAASPVLAILALVNWSRYQSFVEESEKFSTDYSQWISTQTSNEARIKEIEQSIRHIESEFPYGKLAERMLARYPKILDQMATPSGKLASLFEKWGVED